MTQQKNRYSLFEVTGVELEYMIVDRTTLNVKPLCDELLRAVTGQITSDYENGTIAWSNEIVNHVVELKTNGPVNSLYGLNELFYNNIVRINSLLEQFNAVLLPTGAHPWMNPFTETRLWEHDYNKIYALYNRIFDCRGHGWSNLQSTHINLPFKNDEEFAKLHAAIRMLLPLIPALCASTPLLDGKLTGFVDSRLETYRHNQNKISVIAGKVIPEQAFSEQEYYEKIFNPIIAAITPFDEEGVLEHFFLNSRGAIARFDRGAIEIRVLDIQECPKADVAIVEAIVAVLQLIVEECFGSFECQKGWHEDNLSELLFDVIKNGENSIIKNSSYLEFWGCKGDGLKASDLWKHIVKMLDDRVSADGLFVVKFIIENGTLSSRIINGLNNDFSLLNQQVVYNKLIDCLVNNRLFTAK
jgi:gamma-glutamyl:cysteine ligase YbdK (ATP-grasp superfamily)